MAMQTLKLVQKLGYDIVKRKNKPHKKMDEKFYCSECKHPVSKFQIYCDKCGVLLDIDWSLHKK
jgi:hypothetical protein